MQKKDLDIATNQVLVIGANELDMSLKRDAAFQRLKSKVENLDNVISISSSNSFLGSNLSRSMVFLLESDAEKKSRGLLTNNVGENFFKTMGLKLLYGRDFKAGNSVDSTYVILSEAATPEVSCGSFQKTT